MRVIVAGTGRKSGKTTLVCRILRMFPERRWTAVKISHHAPESGAPFEILEEAEAGTSGDTRRYLAAGAARAFWVRGDFEAALPALERLLGEAGDWIVESTRAARRLACDVVLVAGAGEPPSDGELRARLGAERKPQPDQQPR
jgi:molybdopterin-guanine dinucleotide biosynthesis protein